MKIGVIGYGYWGPNLVRNLAEIDGVQLAWCSDLARERLAIVKRRYPAIQISEQADDVLRDPAVEAVVIATPVSTHHALVRRALEHGKHVLVEKPMTQTVAEAEALLRLADRSRLVLMVDHTFVYTGAVRRMKAIVDAGDLGDVYYLDSVRVNLGHFQHDTDVLWDLGPHDAAILTHLVAEAPQSVQATGAGHTVSGFSDVVYLTVTFANDFIAHFHLNWLSPVKIRQMLIGGSRRMLVYDDMQPSEKVRIYDRGVHVTGPESIYTTLVDYRLGDMWAPKLDNREALAVECEHFVDCVRLGRTPETDGVAGLKVVRLLEAAARSLAAGGARVGL